MDGTPGMDPSVPGPLGGECKAAACIVPVVSFGGRGGHDNL